MPSASQSHGIKGKNRVKKFDEMNESEQNAWWLEIARIALVDMGISFAELSLQAYTHNPVFLAVSRDKEYFVRLSPISKEQNVTQEIIILRALQAKGIAAPIPKDFIRVRDRLVTVFLKLEGLEKSVHAIHTEDLEAIGYYLAKLHHNSIGQHNSRPKLDYAGLFSDKGLYPLSDNSKALFTRQQLNLMDTVALTVKSAMDELGQGEDEFGLIHGDLLLKNILFHEREVRALDFEYCGWGYYLYDLCPLLWQLKPLPNYKELEGALWNGYCSIRPLTERHRQLLETFIAARQVASLRWVAANQHNPAYQGKVTSILQQRTAELQGFLETGILKRN